MAVSELLYEAGYDDVSLPEIREFLSTHGEGTADGDMEGPKERIPAVFLNNNYLAHWDKPVPSGKEYPEKDIDMYFFENVIKNIYDDYGEMHYRYYYDDETDKFFLSVIPEDIENIYANKDSETKSEWYREAARAGHILVWAEDVMHAAGYKAFELEANTARSDLAIVFTAGNETEN
ncbi:MAG: hypothetical protein HUJ76_09635 [Parasporobacterium sp.]|nr:hypothetical protein [Parasporobacterium sp.]